MCRECRLELATCPIFGASGSIRVTRHLYNRKGAWIAAHLCPCQEKNVFEAQPGSLVDAGSAPGSSIARSASAEHSPLRSEWSANRHACDPRRQDAAHCQC